MNERVPTNCWLAALGVTTVLLLLAALPVQQLEARPASTSDRLSFSPHWLRTHARDLSTRPYRVTPTAADSSLRSLSYDDYRRINFASEAAIWRDENRPFQLQMFHPGFIHNTPVGIHLVEGGEARPLRFSTDLFD